MAGQRQISDDVVLVPELRNQHVWTVCVCGCVHVCVCVCELINFLLCFKVRTAFLTLTHSHFPPPQTSEILSK